MSKEGAISNAEAGTVAEVDRIRDIIFGPQMRVYEQQFRRVAGEMDRLVKQVDELRDALAQQRAEQEESLSQTKAELEQSVDQVRTEVVGRLEQQGADVSVQVKRLGDELRKQGKDLRSEYTDALHTVENEKASRLDLGDLLVEMGMRLKEQIGIADLLGQLGEMQPASGEGEAPEAELS